MGNRFFVCVVSAFFAFLFSVHNKIPASYKRRAGVLFTSCFHRVSLFDFSAFYAFSLEGKTSSNTDGDIGPVCRNSQIGPHVRCDIECRPGKKPECDARENDT